MRDFKKLALVFEDFPVGGAGQQLVDRFLFGFPHDGEFHRFDDLHVSSFLAAPAEDPNLLVRRDEHGLVVEDDLEGPLGGCHGVIVVCRDSGLQPNSTLLREILGGTPEGTPIFVNGVLGSNVPDAKELAALAAARGCPLATGTATSVTARLPDVDLASGTELREALIVVQGASSAAELEALSGLLPIIERRRGGECGVKRVRHLEGKQLWNEARRGAFSWDLFAAAVSRTDNPLGDSVRDGRTQDLVSLGLVPKLAKQPRAWLLEHADGLRTALVAFDGVFGDFCFAVRAADGTTTSAQLFRPAPPQQEQYSRLAAVLEQFFVSGTPPWPVKRSLLTAGLMEHFRAAGRRGHGWKSTPSLVM